MKEKRLSVGVVVLVVATMALAACGTSVDKAGGDTLVLQLATIDSVNNNGQSFGPQAFVDSLSEVSDGRLRVDVVEAYGDGRADAESQLIEAIAAGDLDGGWPSTRAFANAGISGLEVVEAPMTITSYDAEKALVTSPVAEQLLSRLEGTGVVGLSLAVGPLRRPFAAESPLLGLEDWAGTPFRVYNSPVQDQAMRALDAVPVNLGFSWVEEIEAGKLRGAEFDVAQYHANGFGTEAGNVTSNVVLWPKVFVLSISQQRFDALTAEQRGWVQEAAERATQASVEAAYDETSLAREMCDRGVRFVEATQGQLADLRRAFQPVIDSLAKVADNGTVLEGIQGIATAHPGVEPLDVPAECTQVAATGPEADGIPEGIPTKLDGTYRVELKQQEVFDAVQSNEGGWSGTWTLTIKDGTWTLGCHPLEGSKDCGNTGDIVQDDPFEAGDVRGNDRIVHLIGSEQRMAEVTGCDAEAGECGEPLSYELHWKVEGDKLTLTDAPGGLSDPYTFVIEPWTRID